MKEMCWSAWIVHNSSGYMYMLLCGCRM